MLEPASKKAPPILCDLDIPDDEFVPVEDLETRASAFGADESLFPLEIHRIHEEAIRALSPHGNFNQMERGPFRNRAARKVLEAAFHQGVDHIVQLTDHQRDAKHAIGLLPLCVFDDLVDYAIHYRHLVHGAPPYRHSKKRALTAD